MAGHAETLVREERLGPSLAGSVLFHAALLASVLGYNHWASSRRDTFGDQNPGGPSVGIDVVSKIPLLRPDAPQNPVANNTESQVPTAPAKERERTRAPEPDAIPIKGRKKQEREKKTVAAAQRKLEQPSRPNQMTSTEGRQLSSPMYGIAGQGGVSMSNSNPFGNRFGAYAAQLQRLVSQRWAAQGNGPRTATPALVSVEIQRDGSFRIVRVEQSSGNYTIDSSARRALAEVNQFPPLPAGFERNSAVVEFAFQVKQ